MPSCPACNTYCRSERGLQQHLNSQEDCTRRLAQSMGTGLGDFASTQQGSLEFGSTGDKRGQKRKESTTESPMRLPNWFKSSQKALKTRGLESDSSEEDQAPTMDADDDAYSAQDLDLELLAPENRSFDEENEANLQLATDEGQPETGPVVPDFNNDRVLLADVNTDMQDGFRGYCANMRQNHLPELLRDQIRGIKLLDILRRKKAPLDTYDEVMRWHFIESGAIDDEDEGFKRCEGYISRRKLIKQLAERYNMQNKMPQIKELVLPYSRAKVDVVCHNAYGCIESLLTDPRLTDDDFWFFDDDPTASPPESVSVIGDIYTGKAYRDAVKQYKKEPNHVVLPIIMYIDDSETGAMKNMPITALKMTLGIFKREYRDQDHAWRALGYVPKVTHNQSRAIRIARDSGHIASYTYEILDGEGEDYVDPTEVNSQNKSNKPGDYHAMLDKILESYRDVQANGFKWDLRYKGQTRKGLIFIPFVLFIKCDTKEGDMLAGSYNTYTDGVKNLCRYCVCPTEDSDNPEARYQFKTVPHIKGLVDQGDLEALKAISQQCVANAFWKIRFSPSNSKGIHGSTPSEPLHAVLLGNLMYTRDTFYEQIGKTSRMAKAMDEQSQLFAGLFGRQSERNMPHFNFTNGIREGKIMAKEYIGVILIMASVLHSTKGRNTFIQHPDFNAKKIRDWAYLCELIVVWYAFMSSPSMSVPTLSRFSTRTRHIMWLFKKIAWRSTGMGLKLMKFHALTHLGQDILAYGVPMNFDTGSDEKGHKGTKVAAKLTQRNQRTFIMQTATRQTEFLMIDLALQEMRGRKLWNYGKRSESSAPIIMEEEKDEEKVTTGETRINIILDGDDNPTYSLGVGHEARKPATKEWDPDIIDFLYQLQIKLRKWEIRGLNIRSDHRRHGQIFRGHPNFRNSGPWRDWVIIDWEGEVSRRLPAQIWCFLVLSNLPQSRKKQNKYKNQLNHGACDLKNGVYAVVESAQYLATSLDSTQNLLFRRLNLQMNGQRRLFYLVDTEAFVEPCCIIPDYGSANRRAFMHVKNRDQWPGVFEKWLERDLPQEYLDDKAGNNLPH